MWGLVEVLCKWRRGKKKEKWIKKTRIPFGKTAGMQPTAAAARSARCTTPLAISCCVRFGNTLDWPGLSQHGCKAGRQGGRGVNTGSQSYRKGCKRHDVARFLRHLWSYQPFPNRAVQEGPRGVRPSQHSKKETKAEACWRVRWYRHMCVGNGAGGQGGGGGTPSPYSCISVHEGAAGTPTNLHAPALPIWQVDSLKRRSCTKPKALIAVEPMHQRPGIVRGSSRVMHWSEVYQWEFRCCRL